eukprot:TRINITY_DN269_c0_g2_i2.p1 TRINITY_DN269_c0_g2~~TRINITY_DN269_c0_g2_i2.p1  ORF type:complete len:815 (-),score=130.19 TRINITY_DN269_c0_g2_i2:311-2755(-)
MGCGATTANPVVEPGPVDNGSATSAAKPTPPPAAPAAGSKAAGSKVDNGAEAAAAASAAHAAAAARVGKLLPNGVPVAYANMDADQVEACAAALYLLEGLGFNDVKNVPSLIAQIEAAVAAADGNKTTYDDMSSWAVTPKAWKSAGAPAAKQFCEAKPEELVAAPVEDLLLLGTEKHEMNVRDLGGEDIGFHLTGQHSQGDNDNNGPIEASPELWADLLGARTAGAEDVWDQGKAFLEQNVWAKDSPYWLRHVRRATTNASALAALAAGTPVPQTRGTGPEGVFTKGKQAPTKIQYRPSLPKSLLTVEVAPSSKVANVLKGEGNGEKAGKKIGTTDAKKGEIVCCHLGAPGCGAGVAFWDQLLTEHGLAKGSSEATGRPWYHFDEQRTGGYTPRAVLLDWNEAGLASARAKEYFAPQSFVQGNYKGGADYWGMVWEDVDGNEWRQTSRDRFKEASDDAFRKQAERCGGLSSFLISTAGSDPFGAGWGGSCLEALSSDYAKKLKVAATFLDPFSSYAVDRPKHDLRKHFYSKWQLATWLAKSNDDIDLGLMLSEGTMDGMIAGGAYKLAGRVLANFTSGLRMGDFTHHDNRRNINSVVTNLVPYPVIKWVTPCIVPKPYTDLTAGCLYSVNLKDPETKIIAMHAQARGVDPHLVGQKCLELKDSAAEFTRGGRFSSICSHVEKAPMEELVCYFNTNAVSVQKKFEDIAKPPPPEEGQQKQEEREDDDDTGEPENELYKQWKYVDESVLYEEQNEEEVMIGTDGTQRAEGRHYLPANRFEPDGEINEGLETLMRWHNDYKEVCAEMPECGEEEEEG